ncbi:dipeptidase PepE [Seonamhaeicola sp. MEBiC1930]|uniref:dipeptidase PepE n=1 Tax=Seonamhaeicola sp. MEBiC01930 TaxID=2976768 RepID=UPI00324E427B
MKKLLIVSTSTIHGSSYLEYLLDELSYFFKNTKEILFIPYARPSGISHDEYTTIAKKAFSKINKEIIGIHTFSNPIEAIKTCKGIFVGGGNTFLLTKTLHKNCLIDTLKKVVNQGIPYLGTSAGSNICGLTIGTTNDMPIVYPPSFDGLKLVPFNINPHYLDPNKKSKHMGETRETRISEFHHFNNQPVIGLREGSWLKVNGDSITLNGKLTARVFEINKKPYEIDSGSEINYLK